MKGSTSKLVHGNIEETQKDRYRSLKTPIYNCASFDFESSEDVEDAFIGKKDAYMYSRVGNPTVTELQDRLVLLSEAEKCICVGSGMAAIATAICSVCSAGDNIIASSFLFGNSYSLLDSTLAAFGIETRFVDLQDKDAISEAIDEHTKAIFFEMLTNPQLVIYDVEMFKAIAEEHKILLIVDNSVLTPYIFKAKKWGVDVEVLSTTKFISGGATSVGGAILMHKSERWKHNQKLNKIIDKFGEEGFKNKLFKEVFRNFGPSLSPNNAYLQLLGLETLTLRIDRVEENAIEVAKYLENHLKTKSVEYSTLPSSPNHTSNLKYLNGKAGSLILLELKDKEASYRFMNALKMIRRGTNFCDNKSMIIHPNSTILSEFNEETRANMQITDGMMRFSVGIENVADIISDLDQALAHV